MTHQIHYKNHLIELNGIVATISYDGSLIYKTRFIDAVEAVKTLKAFINLRVEQMNRDRSINIYA
jgi:hypothetical protein